MTRTNRPLQNVICVDCAKKMTFPYWRVKHRLENNLPIRCNNCARIQSRKTYKENYKNNIALQQKRSNIMKDWHKNNPEKSSEIGKKRRNHVKISGSEMRMRQQESIDNDPVKYEKYCQKRKQIAIDFHNSMNDEEKEQHYRKVFKNRGKSKRSEEFFMFLKENHIIDEIELEKYINGYIVDGCIENKKLIIEYYGDMFHCNPRNEKFKNPEKYCSWIGRTVREQWNRDRKRLAVLYRLGYRVLIIWESDWINKRNEQLERILNALY